MLTILQGDAPEKLLQLPDESVQCCVTSPPYWGLRDYSCDGQLGLEKTPEEYVAKMVEVFREVRRVLRKDGTLWLNLGDSYASNGVSGLDIQGETSTVGKANPRSHQRKFVPNGLKPKDLCGIPWRVAFALQADGWWLRSDIIWAKPNPMPESVTDRPTKSHEYLFLLTKSATYFYDAEAIKEKSNFEWNSADSTFANPGEKKRAIIFEQGIRTHGGDTFHPDIAQNSRNKRSVWTVATAPYPEAHFATYPPDLIKPCIMAGTSAKGCCAKCGAPWERIVERGETTMRSANDGKGYVASVSQDMQGMRKGILPNASTEIKTLGWQPTCECSDEVPFEISDPSLICIPCTVLDPFAGSGTTGMVALELGRKAVLIELNPKYIELIEARCNVTPGLALA